MGQTRRRLVLALVAALTVAACSSGAGTHAPAPVASSPSPAASGVPDPVPSSSAPTSETAGTDWPEYHGDAQRSGVSAGMPAASGRLTARGVTLDGQVYASPVIAGGTVVVATETNHVYGLTLTGDLRWQQQLGSPTQRSALPCGNIDPLGITGTPIVRGGTVYLVASVGDTVSHQLYALDLASGAVRWHRSVDVPGADPQAMQQRGALAVAGGRVWVPFGGLAVVTRHVVVRRRAC